MPEQRDDTFLRSIILRIAKQSPGYFIATLAPALAGFMLLPIFSYYITPAEYGIYALLQVAAVAFSIFSSLGVPAMVPFYFTEESDGEFRKKKLGNLLIWMTIINVTLLSLLLSVGAPLFKLAFPTVPFYPYIIITLAQSFFLPYIDTPIVTWKIQEKATKVARMALVRVTVISILQLLCVVRMEWGLLGLLLGSLVGTILSATLFMFLIRGEVAFWLSWSELEKALRIGLPSIPNNIFTYIYRFSDRVILERFVSHEMLGLYYLALRFGDLVRMGVDVLGQAWMPIFYKEAGDRQRTVELMRVVTLTIIIIGTGSLLVYFGAEIYVRTLMNSSFHGAIYLIPFAVVAQMLKGNYVFPHLSIWVSKKTYYFPVITVVPMVVSVGLNLYFIPIYGVYGAGSVMVFCYFLHTILTYTLGQKALPLPYEYGKIALITLIAGSLIFAKSALLDTHHLSFRFLFSAVLYGCVASLLTLSVLRARSQI